MREQTRLAIMFADIAGSTQIYEKLGDAKAREITSRCIEVLSETTERYGGRVIKTIGDEVMCTFPDASEAARGAIDMQEQVSELGTELGYALKIRVGFHFGEVIQEIERRKVDVFGDAVNLAARMAAQAKGDQIMTTGETVEMLAGDLQENTRFIISTTVKGKTKPVEIFELTWGEKEELTIMGGFGTAATPAAPQAKLTVSFENQSTDVTEDKPSITLGRANTNHLCVPSPMSSRVHAKIEHRRGSFFVVDQSTNGTYLMTEEGEEIFVHRDERRLVGEGHIGLGQKTGPKDPMAIRYVLKA
ncbi:MAG: adenylate/guanylate cyclase domain-containing protein [Magnetococcales bacterium]|nr:adenylate/guanylate cyclase domain-containing protein [Magnetococcales bacterium]MBF0308740.1 adenylate/guanylate cyclase domain-containing protein [Magnetococcales bacterium]